MILEAANKYYVEMRSALLIIQHYIKNNLAVFITILYLIGSFAGVIYLATLLNNFSVDVFQHIELSDFLFALISNPSIILSYTGFILFTVIATRFEFSRIPDPNKPTLLKKIYYGFAYPLYLVKPTYLLVGMLLLPLCSYPYWTANAYSEAIKEKRTQSYSISLNDPIQKNQTNLLTEIQVITSTSRNLFIYDNKKDKLLIIPQNNIAALVPLLKAEITVEVKSANEQIKK